MDSHDEQGQPASSLYLLRVSLWLCVRGSIFHRREQEKAEFSQRDCFKRGGLESPANKLLVSEVVFHLTLLSARFNSSVISPLLKERRTRSSG